MLDPLSRFILDNVIDKLGSILVPLMIFAFVGGVFLRSLIYYIARVERKFATEFEKRVRFYFTQPDATRVASFSRLTRILLEKTHHDVYAKREKYKRRSLDYCMSLIDRLFLIEDGIKRLVEDTQRQIRFLRRDGAASQGTTSAKMTEIVRSGFETNPYFNRIFGVFPVHVLHETLNILPGLFLIGGIFGTFIGISKGLPELGSMDLANMAETKRVMDLFLVQISQAMVKSIIGIGFSAFMTVVNTVFATESTFYAGVNRYSQALEQLWHETTTNDVDLTEVPNEKSA